MVRSWNLRRRINRRDGTAMRIAAFNSHSVHPDRLDLAEQVRAWLQTVQPNDLSALATKFNVTSAFMRPIVESLVAQKRLSMGSNGRRNVYGRYKEPVDVLAAVRTWKPLQPTKQDRELWDRLKAERNAVQSKHV